MSEPGDARRPVPAVTLSTSSVYPGSCSDAFEAAARLGYDGVEVMVWTDPVSRDPVALRRLSAHYGVPVLSVHAPTLLLTQRVWGDPWTKLEKSVELAQDLGADVVVAHPPFRWQREYAAGFVAGVKEVVARTGTTVAVENMFPWRAGGREVLAYSPGWDVVDEDYDDVTLDVSHAATSGSDSRDLARRLAGRLRHVHLTDGNGSAKDEHLVPGRGRQPVAELLADLAAGGFTGHVVAEINTRRAKAPGAREKDLADTLAFARRHLGQA
ncbi:sugar phosphate isomerase/epimerase family protein [Pseudokineococcus sp. 1T1Z-3]|uniref:sugar phosphate isomerase/epimerase family protein n=1 Tax=Pseudokineococcus sp. 1T1Z-3 TaxID=3132745 RepID=UPI0030B398E5